ncbi:C-terminal binding protein [Breznakiella homolactica]|uniref:C-terminal binding protein n=1 Tax=Breznakiella homolactica TaxID=2798577 RepID=A0A7T8BAX6_9SPIR|nr:C-terminal binding protein [Breznakiella homolactica]QQO09947.1 C-terminal binding protein [Breznakiella homolactica]
MSKKYLVMRVDHDGGRTDLSEEAKALARADAEIRGADCVTEEEIIAAAADADVLLTASAQITRRVLEALPKSRGIIRYGVGYDTIDIDAATDHGVVVINNPAPAWCTEEVSNHAMMLLLGCAKKIGSLNGLIKQRNWAAAKQSVFPMVCVHGQTAGIIGCGYIGRRIAEKARCFNLTVLGYDPYADSAAASQSGIELTELDTLLRESDFIILQTPLTEETYHLIGEKEFSLMKSTAYIINTARGDVIDEAALIAALRRGTIAGAGLDVFAHEPPEPDNPLLAMDNVIMTPHCASWSDTSFNTLYRLVGSEAAEILSGKMPQYLVNKGVKPKADLR